MGDGESRQVDGFLVDGADPIGQLQGQTVAVHEPRNQFRDTGRSAGDEQEGRVLRVRSPRGTIHLDGRVVGHQDLRVGPDRDLHVPGQAGRHVAGDIAVIGPEPAFDRDDCAGFDGAGEGRQLHFSMPGQGQQRNRAEPDQPQVDGVELDDVGQVADDVFTWTHPTGGKVLGGCVDLAPQLGIADRRAAIGDGDLCRVGVDGKRKHAVEGASTPQAVGTVAGRPVLGHGHETRAGCCQGFPVAFPVSGGETRIRFDLTGSDRVHRVRFGSSGDEGFPAAQSLVVGHGCVVDPESGPAQSLHQGDQSQRVHAVVGKRLLGADVGDLIAFSSQQFRQQLVQKIHRIRFVHPRLPFDVLGHHSPNPRL